VLEPFADFPVSSWDWTDIPLVFKFWVIQAFAVFRIAFTDYFAVE